ncbi:alpha/beta hydrolase [Dactylosporangium salmoneum]|uniref:Alpha/beta hydrolase n=1 Tax=Dactylosporangium salmoneum TaxID=53361 RepID=A0ABN3HYZ5_9ACTN
MRLARNDSGAGAPMVLLHGGGSGRGTWDAFTREAEGYRVVAPDLRGHGESPRCSAYTLGNHADDVLELLDELALGPVVLVGHSLGGHVASVIAQREPGRVARLVLEDPPVPPRDGPAGGFSRAKLALSALTMGLRRRRFDRVALTSAIEQLREPDPGWWAGLGRIAAPTLVLSGGPKSHIPPVRLEELAAAVPGARLATIAVGHRIHSLAPRPFAAAVKGFLRETG